MRHLRILRYVDEVARAGSIRKAAARLNVTASAVNRRIIDLEEELGAELLLQVDDAAVDGRGGDVEPRRRLADRAGARHLVDITQDAQMAHDGLHRCPGVAGRRPRVMPFRQQSSKRSAALGNAQNALV